MAIQNIVIVGAGMMGKGIAQVFTNRRDTRVTLFDTRDGDVLGGIRAELTNLSDNGIIDDVEERLSRIRFTLDKNDAAFSDADLIVEAVFEDLQVKRDLFAELEKIAPKSCIFATNTSVISPTLIAEGLADKSRLVGMHFWNPAYLIPIVDVVRSNFTSGDVTDAAIALLDTCGKKPIYCKKDVPGFIANRLQHALWREALYMVENDIADPATIDDALKYGPGLRWPVMGPMENIDMIGVDLSYDIQKNIVAHLADNKEPSKCFKELTAKGDLGFKTGKGFQTWSPEEAENSRAKLRKHLIKMMKEINYYE